MWQRLKEPAGSSYIGASETQGYQIVTQPSFNFVSNEGPSTAD